MRVCHCFQVIDACTPDMPDLMGISDLCTLVDVAAIADVFVAVAIAVGVHLSIVVFLLRCKLKCSVLGQ